MPRVLEPFEYFEPKTIEEAINTLSAGEGKAKVLAGGVDLVSTLRRREVEIESVVSIQKIPGLNFIDLTRNNGLRIGALTTLRTIELSPLVQKHYRVISEAISKVSSIQVKTMGTAVGNLCVGTPASDLAPSLIALGAALEIAGQGSLRTVPLEEFFMGVKKTILQPNEVVTQILIPAPAPRTGSAFLNLVRTASDIAKINIAVTITVSRKTCKDVKIVLGAVAPIPMRAKEAEEAIKGKSIGENIIERVAQEAANEVKPITDIRSTDEYRREMAKILVKKGIERALARATG